MKPCMDHTSMVCACTNISRIAEALEVGAFSRSAHGLLEAEHSGIPKEQNAREWIIHNYDVVGGALGLISALADMVAEALSGED